MSTIKISIQIWYWGYRDCHIRILLICHLSTRQRIEKTTATGFFFWLGLYPILPSIMCPIPPPMSALQFPLTLTNVEDSQFASLVFDPILSINFKIVRITKMLPLKLDVFSSELGYWASHIVPIESVLDGIKLIDRSIYLNGILYFLSLTSYLVCIEFSEKANLILARVIELPAKDEFNSSGSFGASRGSMFYSNCDNFKILVWQLKDGVHWILQHNISIDELVAHPWAFTRLRICHSLGLIKVYGFHPKSEDIYIGTPSLIQKYNPKTKELERFGQLPHSTRMIVRG